MLRDINRRRQSGRRSTHLCDKFWIETDIWLSISEIHSELEVSEKTSIHLNHGSVAVMLEFIIVLEAVNPLILFLAPTVHLPNGEHKHWSDTEKR